MAEVKQPLEVVNRPLTTPAGQVEAGASLGFLFFKDANGDSDNSKFLGFGAGYGITEQLDAHVSWRIQLSSATLARRIGICLT
jgi:hypothetical protein